MAPNPPFAIRLRAVDLAHIDELAKLGGHGKGRSGVVRRFIENGIARALERGVLTRKDASQYGEAPGEDEED